MIILLVPDGSSYLDFFDEDDDLQEEYWINGFSDAPDDSRLLYGNVSNLNIA